MSEWDNLSGPWRESKTWTKSRLVWVMSASWSAIIEPTNRFTLGTSFEQVNRIFWRSKSLRKGRWSPQLRVPNKSYPCSTNWESSSISAFASSSLYLCPNTDHMMLLREAFFRTWRSWKAPWRLAKERVIWAAISARWSSEALICLGQKRCVAAMRRSVRQ